MDGFGYGGVLDQRGRNKENADRRGEKNSAKTVLKFSSQKTVKNNKKLPVWTVVQRAAKIKKIALMYRLLF